MWFPTCLAVLSIENSKTVRNSNYLERYSLGKLSIIFHATPLEQGDFRNAMTVIKSFFKKPWYAVPSYCLLTTHWQDAPQMCWTVRGTLPPKRTLLTRYFTAVNYSENFSQKDWYPYFDLDRDWLVVSGYANGRLCL